MCPLPSLSKPQALRASSHSRAPRTTCAPQPPHKASRVSLSHTRTAVLATYLKHAPGKTQNTPTHRGITPPRARSADPPHNHGTGPSNIPTDLGTQALTLSSRSAFPSRTGSVPTHLQAFVGGTPWPRANTQRPTELSALHQATLNADTARFPLPWMRAQHGASLATPSPQLGPTGVHAAPRPLPSPPRQAPPLSAPACPPPHDPPRFAPGAQTYSRSLPEGAGSRSTRAIQRIPTRLRE